MTMGRWKAAAGGVLEAGAPSTPARRAIGAEVWTQSIWATHIGLSAHKWPNLRVRNPPFRLNRLARPNLKNELTKVEWRNQPDRFSGKAERDGQVNDTHLEASSNYEV